MPFIFCFFLCPCTTEHWLVYHWWCKYHSLRNPELDYTRCFKFSNIITEDNTQSISTRIKEHFCFIFGRTLVQISARRPATLIEVIRGFPKYLWANYKIVP
jgi:hypothetical protein